VYRLCIEPHLRSVVPLFFDAFLTELIVRYCECADNIHEDSARYSVRLALTLAPAPPRDFLVTNPSLRAPTFSIYLVDSTVLCIEPHLRSVVPLFFDAFLTELIVRYCECADNMHEDSARYSVRLALTLALAPVPASRFSRD
jgi:hypothetical protein